MRVRACVRMIFCMRKIEIQQIISDHFRILLRVNTKLTKNAENAEESEFCLISFLLSIRHILLPL